MLAGPGGWHGAGLAAAVRPGGTLLVVGHHPDDLHANVGRVGTADRFWSAEAIAASLDPGRWEVVVADAPGRSATDLDGQPVTVRDTVLRAVRRPTGASMTLTTLNATWEIPG